MMESEYAILEVIEPTKSKDKSEEQYIIENTSECKFRETKLVDENGVFHQKKTINEALFLAKRASLDLVCFNEPTSDSLALCKIINFGKWKYQLDKSKRKSEKIQRHETKEIRFSHVISPHDIEHKMRQVKTMLDRGDNVVLTIPIFGNPKQAELARLKINEILQSCSSFIQEVSRKTSYNQISVQISKV